MIRGVFLEGWNRRLRDCWRCPRRLWCRNRSVDRMKYRLSLNGGLRSAFDRCPSEDTGDGRILISLSDDHLHDSISFQRESDLPIFRIEFFLHDKFILFDVEDAGVYGPRQDFDFKVRAILGAVQFRWRSQQQIGPRTGSGSAGEVNRVPL